MSAEDIFGEVLQAIKTHHPDLLVRDHLNQEGFEHILKFLRDHANNLETYSFRMHWFSTENRLKVVMPTFLHECVGSWMYKAIGRAARSGLLPNAWDDTIDMMPAPECQNFVGRHAGSFKEPDMAFVPRIGPSRGECASFPSVVVESGWQESATRHLDDARLWLEGSGNAVRVVLQAKYHQSNESGRIHFVLSVSRAHPDGLGCTISPTYYDIFPIPQLVIQNPTISFAEFYSGDCPDGMEPETQIPFDLALFRETAAVCIRREGYIPA
ncbi:hypothetical protein B9Z19DRAFT_1093469 [Tuber borchii]|uniref:Uncharacterized protein n=1 Tax=Tuber borchii TaxID=42251 RepID=A0A2T6ZFA6_TUBBO|nr:hypothetical protein B9Z19DRAFT_1093469 [Tuber borchii]